MQAKPRQQQLSAWVPLYTLCVVLWTAFAVTRLTTTSSSQPTVTRDVPVPCAVSSGETQPLDRIVILGERNSGTNAFEGLLRLNVDSLKISVCGSIVCMIPSA